MRYAIGFWSTPRGEASARKAVEAITVNPHPNAARVEIKIPGAFGAVLQPKDRLRSNRGVFIHPKYALVAPHPLFSPSATYGAFDQEATARRALTLLDPMAASDMLPPFGLIYVDRDKMTVVQDYAGLARLHVCQEREFCVITNASHLVGDRKLNPFAFATTALAGWAFGDTLLDERFQQVKPATRVQFVRNGDTIERRERSVSFAEISDETLAGGPPAQVAASALPKLAANIAAETGDFTIGLSGGRDSRLMAALFINGGFTPDFFTIDDFPEESEIAWELMQLAGTEKRHSIKPRGAPKAHNGIAQSLTDNARTLVAESGGYMEATYIGMRSPQNGTEYAIDKPAGISGAGGEMGHGFYYPKGAAEIASLSSVVDHLMARLLAVDIVSQDAKQEARRYIERSYSAFSPIPVRCTDAFYLYERLRKWSSLSAVTNSFAPLTHISFVAGALASPVEQIVQNRLHKDLIERLMPQWTQIPFFQGKMSKKGSNRPSIERAAAVSALKNEVPHDALDLAASRRVIENWDAIAPAKRDAIIKRSLLCFEIARQYA